MFIISTGTEKQLSKGYGRWFWFWFIFGFTLLIAGVIVQDVIIKFDPTTRAQAYAASAAGFLAVAGISWLWIVYNSFINLRHRVEQAWSQIDVQLKRRSDLIPNLVTVVEGFRAYEQDLQTLLAELRQQVSGTGGQADISGLKRLSPSLRAVIERYPDLKANQSFAKLQQSLIDTEQRIALARDYFNEIATFYNTRLQIIPDRFAAMITRFRPQTLITAADMERAPIQIHLQR